MVLCLAPRGLGKPDIDFQDELWSDGRGSSFSCHGSNAMSGIFHSNENIARVQLPIICLPNFFSDQSDCLRYNHGPSYTTQEAEIISNKIPTDFGPYSSETDSTSIADCTEISDGTESSGSEEDYSAAEVVRRDTIFVHALWGLNDGHTSKGASTAGSVTSHPESKSSVSSAQAPTYSNNSGKLQGDGGGNSPMDEGDGRLPKRPRDDLLRSVDEGRAIKLACPFRKHDPRKYTIQSSRHCALSHWESISRVKEHLYRSHKAPAYCPRCLEQFETQDKLTDHKLQEHQCKERPGKPPDGVTEAIKERLKSRRKLHPGQSREERWFEIYSILFPGEPQPTSALFEPIQDDTTQSPDLIAVERFTTYSHREIPRMFQSRLEDHLQSEAGHLSGALRDRIAGRMADMIRDCQEQVFLQYRSQYIPNCEDSISSTSTGSIRAPTPLSSTPIQTLGELRFETLANSYSPAISEADSYPPFDSRNWTTQVLEVPETEGIWPHSPDPFEFESAPDFLPWDGQLQ